MNTTELAEKFVGKTGKWRNPLYSGLLVNVRIVNARRNYGRIDLRIEPESGEGGAWVDSESIECLK